MFLVSSGYGLCTVIVFCLIVLAIRSCTVIVFCPIVLAVYREVVAVTLLYEKYRNNMLNFSTFFLCKSWLLFTIISKIESYLGIRSLLSIETTTRSSSSSSAPNPANNLPTPVNVNPPPQTQVNQFVGAPTNPFLQTMLPSMN